MRDMLTSDDENDQDMDDYPAESHRPVAPSQSTTTSKRTPQLSSADFPAVSSNIPALPASASWAKIGTNSTPSTPVLAVSDAFGPTLSAAVAASQQKTQFPPMPKRKSEKKKRKEQLQQQKSTPEQTHAHLHVEPSPTPSKAESTKSEQTSSSPISASSTSIVAPIHQPQQEHHEPVVVAPIQSLFEQGLTGFVLGQAYKDLCPLPSDEEFENKQKQADDAEEQLILGVSALLLDDSERPQPSPAQRHLEAIQSAASSVLLPVNIPSVLDFLTYSTPTPKYNGRFNPFAHSMATLGGNQAPPQQMPNGVLNNSLDSPIRRHSRFGFAQA